MQEKSKTNTGFWRESAAQLRRVASLAGAGVLSALGIVLKGLTVQLGALLRVNFSFLTAALSGYLYGPIVAGLAAVVVDLLGFLLVPSGPFFIGFVLNAFLDGIIYGCWLYKKEIKVWRCAAAVATSMLVISFLLTPIWLNILYGDAWLPLVLMRIPKNAVLLPVNTALLYGLLRVMQGAQKRAIKG